MIKQEYRRAYDNDADRVMQMASRVQNMRSSIRFLRSLIVVLTGLVIFELIGIIALIREVTQ